MFSHNKIRYLILVNGFSKENVSAKPSTALGYKIESAMNQTRFYRYKLYQHALKLNPLKGGTCSTLLDSKQGDINVLFVTVSFSSDIFEKNALDIFK